MLATAAMLGWRGECGEWMDGDCSVGVVQRSDPPLSSSSVTSTGAVAAAHRAMHGWRTLDKCGRQPRDDACSDARTKQRGLQPTRASDWARVGPASRRPLDATARPLVDPVRELRPPSRVSDALIAIVR